MIFLLKSYPILDISIQIGIVIYFLSQFKYILIQGNKNVIEITDKHISSGTFRTIEWEDVNWDNSIIKKGKVALESMSKPNSNKVIFFPHLYDEPIVEEIMNKKSRTNESN